MKRLLFWLHRWLGVALAVFMSLWFFSGLVIMYAAPVTATRHQQLAHGESLQPESDWLSLGEAWERSRTARVAAKVSLADAVPAEARLVRQAGQPLWLVDDDKGRRLALSALDGSVQTVGAADAIGIASQWLQADARDIAPRYVALVEKTSLLRNYEHLAPFHRVAVDDEAGTELLISARSGEVLSAATRAERAMYWAGNWLHLFRPLEAAGWGESRRNVLLWVVSVALAATLTGLIVGWLRWRPGWGGRPTYSEGRVHPYRDAWFKWHFWAGLIGGTFALLWTFSGVVNSNPWQVFSSANPGKEEVARYVGNQFPTAMARWRPTLPANVGTEDVVELAWHRLGDQALAVAYTRSGQRLPLTTEKVAPSRFSDSTLAAAAGRFAKGAPLSGVTLQTEYDSQYSTSHRRSAAERPLPVVRVDIGDKPRTQLYIDPRDGHLLLRLDASRRAYRWLFNALHYWDLAWLYPRPLWDAWMLTWVGLGWALSVTSLVVGWKRVRLTLRRRKRKPSVEGTPTAVLATD